MYIGIFSFVHFHIAIFLLCNFDILTVILHGKIIFCPCLFEVLYASCIWMSISFSKVGNFLAAISLKIFVALVIALAPSLSPRKLCSGLLNIPHSGQKFWKCSLTFGICHRAIHNETLSQALYFSVTVFLFSLY